MKCDVIIPVGPGHEYLVEDSIDSVRDAFANDPGPFAVMSVIRIDDGRGELGRSAARNKGVAQAQAEGAEWLFFLDADDRMDPGAFGVMDAYHADHDAVWGLICEPDENDETYSVRPGQLRSIEHLKEVLVNDPALTLQMGHFVRTAAAAATPFDAALNCGEDFDYYLRLWARFRCRKVAVPLFVNRRGFHSTGPRSATGEQWRQAVRSILRAHCRASGLTGNVECDGEAFKFRVTDPFDRIQRGHLLGKLVEAQELGLVRDRLERGAVILDIGAKTGSRAVYLSRFRQPARIVLVEPDEDLLAALQYNLSVNGVTVADAGLSRRGGNVDRSALESAVGGRCDLIIIDREGLEFEILDSLRQVIIRLRPHLLVNSAGTARAALEGWCDEHGYAVVGRVEHPGAARVVLEARQGNTR